MGNRCLRPGRLAFVGLVESKTTASSPEGRLADPYPLLGWLRDNDPVHFGPMLDSWVITRYEDMFQAFLDPRFRSRSDLGERVGVSAGDAGVLAHPLASAASDWLGYTNLAGARSTAQVAWEQAARRSSPRLSRRVMEITGRLIDNMRGREQCERGGGLRSPTAGSGHMRDSRHTEGGRAQLCIVSGCGGLRPQDISARRSWRSHRGLWRATVDLEGFFGGLVERLKVSSGRRSGGQSWPLAGARGGLRDRS